MGLWVVFLVPSGQQTGVTSLLCKLLYHVQYLKYSSAEGRTLPRCVLYYCQPTAPLIKEILHVPFCATQIQHLCYCCTLCSSLSTKWCQPWAVSREVLSVWEGTGDTQSQQQEGVRATCAIICHGKACCWDRGSCTPSPLHLIPLVSPDEEVLVEKSLACARVGSTWWPPSMAEQSSLSSEVTFSKSLHESSIKGHISDRVKRDKGDEYFASRVGSTSQQRHTVHEAWEDTVN